MEEKNWDMINFETDVLVIGGGGAGAMAAYEASKYGANVMIVLKGRPQRCGSTITAPGAIAGVGDWHVPGDSPDIHFMDTIKGGSFLGEQGLVRIMAEESAEAILELERIGALWERTEDGKTYALRVGGGHSFYRCTYLEDRTGREMLRALFGELKKRNVKILPDTIILKLLKEGDRMAGAAGLDMGTCETVLFRAKTVILACGGAGNLYLHTDNPTDITGDGFSLALESGAELMDMEFVQFFPLGFCFPPSLKGALATIPGYTRLRNSKGERFMEKYDPGQMELSTRDRVCPGILTEIKEGRGGPNGGVFADMTYHPPGFIARNLPALYQLYCKLGIDPEKDYVEVAPTCHFFMGGAKVDENWQSTVPGLFVAGETAAGIHGANRLGQNALADLLVSGKRAGRGAAQFSGGISHAPVDPKTARKSVEYAFRMLNNSGGLRPIFLRNRLRQLMWDKTGAYRTETGLKEALKDLDELKADLGRQSTTLTSGPHNQELLEGLENHFLVATARCVIEAALKRTESRGAHFREDYPETDNDNWLEHIVLYEKNGTLNMKKTPADLREMTTSEETR
ncbi:MAG: FAD-binding protein [Desulfobacteraceae bacterium]|nr:FAD-binding protein [Desulfobacteraceae bacterium]